MFKSISLAVILLLILSLPFFIKVNVDCISQFGTCPEKVVNEIKTYNGKNLFTAKNGIKKVLKNEALVSEYSTQFKLPNIILVNIIAKKPIVSIFDRSVNKYFLVDKDGKILSASESSALPTVIQDNSTPNLLAIKIIIGVNDMYQINTGTIQGDSLVVELPGPVKVIFPLEGDSDVLLGALRLIYSKINSGESNLKYSFIDLRFKNPVLR